MSINIAYKAGVIKMTIKDEQDLADVNLSYILYGKKRQQQIQQELNDAAFDLRYKDASVN